MEICDTKPQTSVIYLNAYRYSHEPDGENTYSSGQAQHLEICSPITLLDACEAKLPYIIKVTNHNSTLSKFYLYHHTNYYRVRI